MRGGFGMAQPAVQQHADAVMRAGVVRLRREYRLECRHRLVIPVEAGQCHGERHACLGIVRIDIQRLAEAADGFLQ